MGETLWLARVVVESRDVRKPSGLLPIPSQSTRRMGRPGFIGGWEIVETMSKLL
jgi:hypothetical protein